MVDVNDDTRVTLILVGVMGFLAIALMALRLAMRKVRGQPFNLGDYLTMVAIFCMLGRTAFTTVVLLWQNNNVSAAYRATHVFTAADIYQREVGGKLTLVNRAVYNTYIWIQKAVVLLLYKRMLAGLPIAERIIKWYWVVLVVTLIPVQVSCFVECTPFQLYWQVEPDPGTCSTAVVQLYVLVAMNVLTDLMLIALPMPWLFRIKRSISQRAALMGLFSIGLGLVIIAICRLPIYGAGTSQVNRNTLGSVEGFFAAFVANVPTLVTLRSSTSLTSTSTPSAPRGGSTAFSTDKRGSKYGRDKFRQMPGTEENFIVVTRDFELVTRTRTSSRDEVRRQEEPQDSVEELIHDISDAKRLNPGERALK